jgi:hypothetical protein
MDCVRVQKGMYGLPQAGIIAQQLLETRLIANRYCQSTVTPGFWKHDWWPIAFALCVDDFGVKYVGIEHAKHLLQALNTHYTTSHDWKGERYLGLTITWDYPHRQVHLSMPGYCHKAGQRFDINFPQSNKTSHTHTHHAPTAPNNNKWMTLTNHPHSPNKTQPLSKRSLGCFSTML